METDNLQQVSAAAAAAAEGTVKMNVDIRYTTTHQRPVFFFFKGQFRSGHFLMERWCVAGSEASALPSDN